MMVCAKLLQDGTCPDGASCRYSHYLKLCALCNCTLVTEHSFIAHLFGKEHCRRVYRSSNASEGICAICTTPYAAPHTVRSFHAHCQTPQHREHALRAGLNFLAEQSEVTNIPDNTQLCRTCNATIPNNIWPSHLQGRRHATATKFHLTKAVQESTTSNKHSVEVSGDEQDGYDFGVVEPGATLRTLNLDIELTAPGRISLVETRLSSQTGRRRFQFTSP